MSFTGTATITPTLPEPVEDIHDIVGIISPYETPLLDHLGDPNRVASCSAHEWLEDVTLSNEDRIADCNTLDLEEAGVVKAFAVDHPDRFFVGDIVQPENSRESLFVTKIEEGHLHVVRSYGGTAVSSLETGTRLRIVNNAAMGEGENRFVRRVRKTNNTQIFTAGVEVSGSQLAAKQAAIADELDYQKQERLRELVRDLENCVINGVGPAYEPPRRAPKPGESVEMKSVRRTLRGIIPSIKTHQFDHKSAPLNEDALNSAIREVWERSNGGVDTILVGGLQKRAINQFIASARGYDARNTRYRDMVSVYESDFGVCRVVLSRWVPADTLLLLDSSRIDVLPMAGRSFHYKPLGVDGDRERGQVIGEYTLELRDEHAHGIITNLAIS